MVEHVEPIADRVVTAPAPRTGIVGRWTTRVVAWSLGEALLFPVVALYVVSLALSLPRELYSDSWYAILGGHEIVHHVLAAGSAFVLAIVVARWRGASMRSVCWIALPAVFLLMWGSWNARAQSLAFVLFVAVVW